MGFPARAIRARFNTQPPEGGWVLEYLRRVKGNLFQHTAARRRLGLQSKNIDFIVEVSTHSRPKAAGPIAEAMRAAAKVSTHSRPKAAGCFHFLSFF